MPATNKRLFFALNSVAPQHQEVGLPGAHFGIGGGYLPQMTEKLLLTPPRYVIVTRKSTNTLTREEYQFLRSRYIHLSANWTPTSGLMLSKPAPKGRLTFANKPQEGYPE